MTSNDCALNAPIVVVRATIENSKNYVSKEF